MRKVRQSKLIAALCSMRVAPLQLHIGHGEEHHPKTALIRIDVPSKRGTCYEKGLVFATEHQSPLLRNFLELVRENMGESLAGDEPWSEKKG